MGVCPPMLATIYGRKQAKAARVQVPQGPLARARQKLRCPCQACLRRQPPFCSQSALGASVPTMPPYLPWQPIGAFPQSSLVTIGKIADICMSNRVLSRSAGLGFQLHAYSARCAKGPDACSQARSLRAKARWAIRGFYVKKENAFRAVVLCRSVFGFCRSKGIPQGHVRRGL